MADALLRFGNGSGGGSDETTATRNQVLRGVTAITSDSGDEPVEGTIVTRGYRGPDTNEMWLYPQEGGYVVRLEEGFYHKDSNSQLKPYVIAPINLVKSAVNYHAEYTLNNTTTCGEQGKIKMINTQDNGYAINQAKVFALDGGRSKLVMLMGHGNGYYYRPDGNPHVEVNASELGNAVKESLLQWQTASSMYGLNFQGTIPRWICGTGDVISAVDNNGFAWDDATGANRGRGVVTKIPNGHYIQGANYVFLPSPNLYPHNIRAGVNIHGVVGTMPDYSTGRTVFNGATFDGTLLSGVANKDFFIINDYYPRYRASNYAYTGIYDGGINLNLNTSMPGVRGRYIGFVFSQSVNLAPFNRIDIYWRFLGDRRNRASIDLYAGVSKASSIRRSAITVGSTPVDGFTEGDIRSYANGISNGGSGKIELYVGGVHEQAFLYLYANATIGGSADLVNGRIQITRIDFLN
jgi:hypothetical protein